MSIALILWLYAAALATIGSWALRRATWTDRAPGVAVVVWQSLSASIILAAVIGSVAPILSTTAISSGMAGLLEACAVAISHLYATPGGAITATVGLGTAVALAARWLYCLTTELTRNRRMRTRHHEMLSLLGRAGPVEDVTVLDHSDPVVYCLAGRPHRIVMTSAATTALTNDHLASVLAHERAHLRGRHDVAVAAARATAAAFPWVPAFRNAQDEVTRLVELVADDYAAKATNRLSLAEAMLTLATTTPPVGALAAKGSSAATRIRRLLNSPRPLRGWVGGFAVTAALSLVAAPFLTVVTPAVSVGTNCCADAVQNSAVATDQCLTSSRGLNCTDGG